MTIHRLIYLDANVLIDLAQDQGEVGSLLQSIVESQAAQRENPLFVTSELTFAEVLVRPYREKLGPLAKFYLETRAGNYWLNVIPVSFPVLERAAALRAMLKPLKLPDAIHLGTAQMTGCSHFLTNDLGLSDIAETPHPLRKEVMPSIAVIRADVGALSSILKELQ